ncbi:MAG: MBL fold metallo-hydrolase [Chloroflexi bacterium]|nr:MBL fold metallo-hydrolase [Chloroflexota bacterium]
MFETNCILVVCPETREAIVVDPGFDGDAIMRAVDELQAKVKYIVITHAHPDHILACDQVKAATGAPVLVHPLDAPAMTRMPSELTFWLKEKPIMAPADEFINEGDELTIGQVVLKVLHTPGHSRGHISLVTDGIAIVGDVLFFQGIGRTDFPGGSFPELIDSIKTKLFPLGDDTVVYPGHGPATTIGDERTTNPFLV